MQATAQPALPQVGEPLGTGAHTVPHALQLEVSAESFTHTEPHSENPALHVAVQPVAPHFAAPFAGVAQVTPQSPQFLGSELTSTQDPAQFLAVVGQLAEQAPLEHTSPG